MKILFKNFTVLFEDGRSESGINVSTNGSVISYVGKDIPEEDFDRVIDGYGKMLIPGMYNCHCHTPMSLFRGIGEDLPLKAWLEEKIYPAEDKLDDEKAYIGTLLSCCEMIKNGIISVSDMYFCSHGVIKALRQSGMKANFGRCIVSFDENADPKSDSRIKEAIEIYDLYHNCDDGRIKIDMSLHAEYTNTEKTCRYVASLAAERNIGIQLHLSETLAEHEECTARRKMTPTEFFLNTGVLDNPVLAAHCVHISESDAEILAEKKATIAHNPTSNLKLASGIGNLLMWKKHGINVVLGTDGAASNNNLDILKELNLCALLARHKSCDPTFPPADSLLPLCSLNGAISQGRTLCGAIKEGYRADIVLIDMDRVSNIPCYTPSYGLVYSCLGSDVCLTMCDGKILYENGEFTTLDVQKIKASAKELM